MKAMDKTIPCIGCGENVPDVDGPIHGYLDASPGCWDLYGQIHWLAPPACLGEVTIVDVIQAKDLAEHETLVHGWARSAWDAWAPHHGAIRRWGAECDG
jgi:hypothetical protein